LSSAHPNRFHTASFRIVSLVVARGTPLAP
jgi:hypothetical protein